MAAGLRMAGASTGRGELGDRQPDATLTSTQAGAPAVTGAGVGEIFEDGEGAADAKGLGERDAPGTVPHAPSAIITASTSTPKRVLFVA